MTIFKKNLDKLILFLASVCFAFLIIFVSYQVFARYLFGKPSVILDEISRFLQIWLALLGASYCWGNKKHIAITILLDTLPKNIKLIVLILIDIVCSAIIIVVLLKGGLEVTLGNLTQKTPAMQIPMGYVYSILPISGVVMLIYSVFNLIEIFKDYKEGTL